MMGSIVPLLGPILGSYLAYSFGWRSTFIFILLLTCMTFILGAFIYLIFSAITLFNVKEKNRLSTKLFKKKIVEEMFFLGKNLIGTFKKLPSLFWKLSLILFFAWIGIFSIWNYFNVFVAQKIMHMPVSITDDLSLSKNYIANANILTAVYFGIMQITGTVFAFCIPYLAIRFSIILRKMGIVGV